MLTHDDGPKPASMPGERAFALALELVRDGRDEVGRYLTAFGRSPVGLVEARTECLARFADRPANRGALLRALALIDAALDRLGSGSVVP